MGDVRELEGPPRDEGPSAVLVRLGEVGNPHKEGPPSKTLPTSRRRGRQVLTVLFSQELEQSEQEAGTGTEPHRSPRGGQIRAGDC